MSGPVTTADCEATAERHAPAPTTFEITESREAKIGGFTVRRALPRRARRTVGAWCFVDHMGPATIGGREGLGVAPHPHIGLQTVTWLFEGEVLHRDSLGSELVIVPGQLNLMTAGRGVSHSEEGTGRYEGDLHGVQLWVAQPHTTRDGDPAFEHHADLPQRELDNATATVIVGDLDGTTAPARRDTDHSGVDLQLRSGTTTLPLHPHHEYALVAFTGATTTDGQAITPGHLAYLGTGRDELALTTTEPTRALLIGGAPFDEQILMWWNFVARTRDEITAAYADWDGATDRFGTVASAMPRVEVGPPPWTKSTSP